MPHENDDLASALATHFARGLSIYYKPDASSLLNGLCEKYGSDKGSTKRDNHPYPWRAHTYADLIERYYGHCRNSVANVFECGLGTNNPDLPSSMGINGKPGASLRVWRDYFPKAQIFGADIDKDILFEEDRIKTFYCDQTDAQSIAQLWQQIPGIEFDLMVDDGLHTYEAGLSLFNGAFERLRKNGLYIIEDVQPQNILKFVNYFENKATQIEVCTLTREDHELADNSLIMLRK